MVISYRRYHLKSAIAVICGSYKTRGKGRRNQCGYIIVQDQSNRKNELKTCQSYLELARKAIDAAVSISSIKKTD
jgi:hypothetical protein